MVTNQDNELPQDFKMTELGPLPQEWRVVRIGDVTHVTAGGSAPQGDHYSGGKNPFIRVQHIDEDSARVSGWNLITDEAVRKYGLRLFPKGTIVFPKSGASVRLEKRAVLPVDAYIVSHLCALSSNSQMVDNTFLFQALRSIRFAKAKAEGYPTLGLSEIKATLIPLPPIPEQRAIAYVLSTIQRAIEAQDKIIAAAKELKKSLMRYLFTYGPVPVAEAEKVSLKETEIGPVPEHWDVVRLGEIAEKTKQFDPRRTPSWSFKYVDVSCISNESLRIESFTEYSGSDAPHRARKLVRTDDIIFATVRPYLKRVAMVPGYLDGQICSTAFCVIRCKSEVAAPPFIFQAITQDNFVDRVSENQRGSSYPAVTDKDILRQLISLPPLPEQQEIAGILSAVDKKIEAEQRRKTALQTLFKTMLHLLMTGEVRVKDLEVPAS